MRREIRTYIQRQIAQGVYRPGDRIVETQLAREMNVSQAPVREALLELAAMGLVEERPYSGTFVRHLKASDIEDIYNTRAFLDEYAARQAARLATQEQLDAADRYAEALGLAFQTRDDMLDVLGDSGKMGKATGMDENKNTFVRLYGVGACSRLIEKETQKAIEALGAFEDSDFLKELSMKLAIREC